MAGTQANDLSERQKSSRALKTISEAASAIDVPQHVLRFWETKFPQIKPLKRNGGRRFYRPDDIEILQKIKFLLYRQGYTIKGAKKLFEQKNNHQVLAELQAAEKTKQDACNDNVTDPQQETLAEDNKILQAAAELRSLSKELRGES